jgi:hypothetical protein
MIGEQVEHFQGKGTNLDALRDKITGYLKGQGFQVQSSKPSSHGTLLQARKGGFMSEVITADRALNILIDGEPNDFTVRLGIGKWAQHLGVMAVETMLLSGIFVFIDVPEMLWTTHIENELANQIASFVG